ncbi:hypothetical protein [Bacillus sp. AFS031507]|nr:hypothetical protein [Bacillus sp. AFS031507]
MSGALAGVRILDLTRVLAGPFCCYGMISMLFVKPGVKKVAVELKRG